MSRAANARARGCEQARPLGKRSARGAAVATQLQQARARGLDQHGAGGKARCRVQGVGAASGGQAALGPSRCTAPPRAHLAAASVPDGTEDGGAEGPHQEGRCVNQPETQGPDLGARVRREERPREWRVQLRKHREVIPLQGGAQHQRQQHQPRHAGAAGAWATQRLGAGDLLLCPRGVCAQ